RAVAAPTSTRNIGMLRDHAPRYHEHQHHGMLCYRDGVSAAVIGNRHLGAARSLEIDIVVAGAEQLVQTEAGRGTLEGLAGAHIGVADKIFGGCERGFELGALVTDDDELEPGRCERAGKLGDPGDRCMCRRWRNTTLKSGSRRPHLWARWATGCARGWKRPIMSTWGPASSRFSLTMNKPSFDCRPAHATDRSGPAVYCVPAWAGRP